MQNKIVFNPDDLQMLRPSQRIGQARNYSVDANYWADKEGATLTSAVWSVEEGDATVASDSESANVSTALVTTSKEGDSLIKVILTLDDTQIGVQYIRILVPLIEIPATNKYFY